LSFDFSACIELYNNFLQDRRISEPFQSFKIKGFIPPKKVNKHLLFVIEDDVVSEFLGFLVEVQIRLDLIVFLKAKVGVLECCRDS
jgi:hypothetical protein